MVRKQLDLSPSVDVTITISPDLIERAGWIAGKTRLQLVIDEQEGVISMLECAKGQTLSKRRTVRFQVPEDMHDKIIGAVSTRTVDPTVRTSSTAPEQFSTEQSELVFPVLPPSDEVALSAVHFKVESQDSGSPD